MFINPFLLLLFIEEKTIISSIFCLHIHANSYHVTLGKRVDEVSSRSSLLLRAAAGGFPGEQIWTAAQEPKFQRRLGPGGDVEVTEFYASV